jgi:hypothetical protein
MPMVIMSWFNDTNSPRLAAGAISAMYSGTIIEASPTPSPSRKRATTRTPTFGETAATMAPAANTRAASRAVGRRPMRSASGPPERAPTTAPTRRKLTMMPSVKGENGPKSCLMNNSAPEITPVSYPKSKPPVAVIAAARLTNFRRCPADPLAAMCFSPSLEV